MSEQELRVLFGALNDGTLSREDHARLQAVLESDPAARQLWFLHCDIETGLADWAALRQAAAAGNVLPFPIEEPSSEAQPRTRTRLSRWWVPMAAAAAAVFLATLGWVALPAFRAFQERAPLESKVHGVAVLARAGGAQWADGVERAAGTVLGPGVLRLKSGAALVEFYSGARLVLEGPAEFQLVSAGEGFLHGGRINAHVPPQARGFTVGSPGLTVVDHGTDFGLSVAGGSAPEVHVFTGRVEVAAPNQAPRVLLEGEAARFEHGRVETMAAARTGFLSEEELGRREALVARERFARWQTQSRTLDADLATVVHYVLDEEDAAARQLINRSAGAAPPSHGSVVGSAWTEGRWPGKRALQFRGEGDRVRLSAPAPMRAVSLVAWVRVESLGRWQNVLLSADSEQPGALHWHLTKRGELRLEIARDLGRENADWEAVNSEPFVTAGRWGQWLQLVTTFDGQTVRHYGNGRLIGSGASFTPPALLIGTAELGNWPGGTQRHLSAAFDEFAILSRAMSAQEVAALFEAGK